MIKKCPRTYIFISAYSVAQVTCSKDPCKMVGIIFSLIMHTLMQDMMDPIRGIELPKTAMLTPL